MEPLNIILITQARTGSTRLPGKVLLEINEQSLLDLHLSRLKKCKSINKIIVATTTNEQDDLIAELCNKSNIQCSRGSEDNVLDRFYQAVKDDKPQWIVRVTSDCPLLDPQLVDAVVECAIVNQVDYCSNTLVENFPDGQDVEVFKFSALEKAWQEAQLKSEQEHVTPFIRNNSAAKGLGLFSAVNFPCFTNFSKIRMTVDEPKDFDLIVQLVNDLGTDDNWLNYTNHIIKNNLHIINQDIVRNEGLLKSLKND